MGVHGPLRKMWSAEGRTTAKMTTATVDRAARAVHDMGKPFARLRVLLAAELRTGRLKLVMSVSVT